VPRPLIEEASSSASRHEARTLLAPGLATTRGQGVPQHRGRDGHEVQDQMKTDCTAQRLKGIRARLRRTRLRIGRSDIGTLAVTTWKMEEE
jgi:hypothetical protein